LELELLNLVLLLLLQDKPVKGFVVAARRAGGMRNEGNG